MQREKTYQQVLKDFGADIPIETLEKEFHLLDKWFMREHPGIFSKGKDVFMPWYLGKLNYRLGLSLNSCKTDARWDEIKETVKNYWLPFSDVHHVLETLRSDGIGLGVISNWDPSARQVLGSAGLTDFFDPIVISAEVGCEKPDKQIFELAIDKAGVDPAQCLYVGDNYYDDALGCRKVGMQALILNRFGTSGVEEITDCPVISHLSDILPYLQNLNAKEKMQTTG